MKTRMEGGQLSRTCWQGTGFVLTADLPLTDEEDEEDEKAKVS